MSDPLAARLKMFVVDTLTLDELPGDLADDEPLVGSARLGIDSIDLLELVMRLEREFGIKIGSSEESRRALANVSTLAAYLRAHGAVAAPPAPVRRGPARGPRAGVRRVKAA